MMPYLKKWQLLPVEHGGRGATYRTSLCRTKFTSTSATLESLLRFTLGVQDATSAPL